MTDRYVKRAAFFEEIEKLASEREKELKHVFVTGYSGAGKTTRAHLLGKELGLPVVHLDKHMPNWERYVRKAKDNKEVWNPLDEWDTGKRNYYMQLVRRDLTNAVAQAKQPTIFEGTPVLMQPRVSEGHRRILVDKPEEQIVKQRVERSMDRAKSKGRTGVTREEQEAIARELIRHYSKYFERFKQKSDIERLTDSVIQPKIKLP